MCVCVCVCVCVFAPACVRASERTCLAAGAQGAIFVAALVVNGDRCKRGSRHVGAQEPDKSRACHTSTRRRGVDQIDRGGLTVVTYVLDFLFILGIFFWVVIRRFLKKFNFKFKFKS